MKKLQILATVFALLIVFSGCNSSNMSYDTSENISNGYWSMDEPKESPETDEIFDNAVSSENQYIGERKLIRTFDLNVETLDFDTFITSLKNEVSSLGGYIESSGISGNSYDYTGNRDANLVCRIPSDKLDQFVSTVGGLGNVTYSYEDTDDVTLNYVDTEARVKSLQTEYDQLLVLLSEAENVDTIILIQQRLTEVRYQIESYQSQLRTYDNLVDYSTVNLSVYEVRRVTAAEPKTVWERISTDFSNNIYDIFVGAEDVFVWFVANIPYFIVWAVIIAVVAVVLNLCFKNNPKWQERKEAKKARKAYKKAQKLAKKSDNENPKNN